MAVTTREKRTRQKNHFDILRKKREDNKERMETKGVGRGRGKLKDGE